RRPAVRGQGPLDRGRGVPARVLLAPELRAPPAGDAGHHRHRVPAAVPVRPRHGSVPGSDGAPVRGALARLPPARPGRLGAGARRGQPLSPRALAVVRAITGYPSRSNTARPPSSRSPTTRTPITRAPSPSTA